MDLIPNPFVTPFYIRGDYNIFARIKQALQWLLLSRFPPEHKHVVFKGARLGRFLCKFLTKLSRKRESLKVQGDFCIIIYVVLR